MQTFVYTSRNGLTKGLRRKGGLGFIPSKRADTDEVKFLQSLSFENKAVYDIGGFHGLMTIFFAKSARHVITYEANPEHVVHIWENIRVNRFQNVIIRAIALSSADGILTLSFDRSYSGAGTRNPALCNQARASGRALEQLSVAMTSLDEDIKRFHLPIPDFIKIDIEGMELDALRGMRNVLNTRKPDFYVELHGTSLDDKRANAAAVLSFLADYKYEIFSVEQKRNISSESSTGYERHIYCHSSG
ncbi:MAG: FkbM family methyltransferase [Acidobacteriaceae bacterium]|nr:FkbM family methyltransferase [Acidobacteriaceae bacterium]